ncbi:GAP family protein [Croceiramulus getboli]|nr:GAP family protein [Flavobacteriaceae bacterium YJPT1-3]
MDVAILPLALTVMLGPQILVAMLLVTREDAVSSSLVYVSAVGITLLTTTYVYYRLAQATDLHTLAVGNRPSFRYVLILLFIYLIGRSILNRKQITEPPKWMQGITKASYGKIFALGCALIAFMPTDIAVSFSVGSLLHSQDLIFWKILPFLGVVMIIAALPLLFFLALGSRGPQYLQQVNQWLNTHGYLINVILFSYFIFLLV